MDSLGGLSERARFLPSQNVNQPRMAVARQEPRQHQFEQGLGIA